MEQPSEGAELLLKDAVELLLVVHVRLYREGLAAALATHAGVRVVGTADDSATALAQAAAMEPDVVVLDVAMPGALDMIALLRGISDAKVIAFAVRENDRQILACLEAGAVAYVTCDSSIDVLVATIQALERDECMCSPRVTAALIHRLGSRPAADAESGDDRSLTTRERQVLLLIRDGLSNKEIGQALNIAEPTVKNHVHHILEKLGVDTRSKAAVRAAGLPARPGPIPVRFVMPAER